MQPLGFGPWVLSFCKLTFLDCENVLWLGFFLVYLKYGVVSFFVIYYYLSCSLFKFCLFIKVLHLGYPWGRGFCSLLSQYFVSRLSLCSTSVPPCVKLTPCSLFSCVFLFYFDNCCSMSCVVFTSILYICCFQLCVPPIVSPLVILWVYTSSLTRSVHGCVIPLWSWLCKLQLCSSHLWFL